MGFRRAKSTQGNTNCQKNIFEDDQVPGHHPRALKMFQCSTPSSVCSHERKSRICLTINENGYYQHLLVSFEELLSLRLSDHFALVVGCINNN